MRHDERTIRNVDDEIYRIAPRTHGSGAGRIDAREEYARDLREKDYLRAQMNRLANGGQPMPMMDPAMMPPPMLPAPGPAPEAQVQVAENAAAQQGEALGQEYLDEMMTGIDTADSTEELIDAMRGDDRTLQERYDELANFVGERDASATPESVLTLVQPTIMMTEQGAMDSGIGELMQGISGEVDMETEMGVPTPMGQGIGELMMSQSVEEVIPEMNAGGPVQRFAPGGQVTGPNFSNIADMIQGLGTPSTEDQFSNMVDERLPVYQRLLGDTDQTQRDLQSKLYFDIAQAGLNLASGTDPNTGQSMAGRPLASQLASAAQPVAASAAQQAGQLRNVERAAAMGALQSAESAESARINAERQAQLALFGGGLEGLSQDRDFLGRSNLLGQQILGESALQTQRDLAAMKRQKSQEEYGMSLQNAQNDANLILQDEGNIDALERAAQNFDYEGQLLNQRGEISTEFLENEQAQQLLIQSIQNVDDRNAAREMIEATKSLQILDNEAGMLRLQTQLDAAATEAGLDRTHNIIMQQDRISENARQFDVDQTRLTDTFLRQLGLDRTALESIDRYRKFQSNEAERQRLATVGGEGTGFFQKGILSPLGILPILNDLGEDSALRQNQEAMDNLNIAKRSGQELAIEQFDYMRQVQNNARFLETQQQAANQQLAERKMSLQEFQAITKAIQDQQRDLTSIFGNSYEGTVRGLLSDQNTLNDYAAGTLDPSTTNVIDQAILVLQEPRSVYDPNTGLSTTQQTDLPRAVKDALFKRTYNNLPLPDEGGTGFNFPNPLNPLINDITNLVSPTNFQSGGEVSERQQQAMERLNRFLGNRDPSLSEPAELPGRIVDETIDFEATTGLPTGFSNIANTVSDTFRDVTGLGPGPLFPDVERGGEQLRAVANMTQRFIRDSVAGRPFAVEIEAMAEEIAQPGAFRMDERNLVKLQTMRSQLLEIGDMAQEILKSPQAFDQKSVISAREDLQQLSPLVDNYNKIIKSYEIGLGKEDKPDPSMFERGLGNAQGNAAGYAGGSIMGPPPGFEEKNMTFLGYDTGVPNSAILANQGGPINRRRS